MHNVAGISARVMDTRNHLCDQECGTLQRTRIVSQLARIDERTEDAGAELLSLATMTYMRCSAFWNQLRSGQDSAASRDGHYRGPSALPLTTRHSRAMPRQRAHAAGGVPPALGHVADGIRPRRQTPPCPPGSVVRGSRAQHRRRDREALGFTHSAGSPQHTKTTYGETPTQACTLT